jgi:VWFA-related protein
MKSLALVARRVVQRFGCTAVRISLFLPFVLYVLPVPPVGAQGSSIRVETFAFKPNGSVSVENSLGTTRVDVWDQQIVRVVAEKKGGGALFPSDLVLMGAQDTVIIQCRQGASPGRIDLMIYVPRRAHLQVNGGNWPIDVNGSLSSAIVETTAGNIGYQVPRADDARIEMQSIRGSVKSTIPLEVTDRAGTRGLQGRIGTGSASIFLTSQAGNITLGPSSKPSSAGELGGMLAANTQQRQSGVPANQPDPRGNTGSTSPRGAADDYDSSGDAFPPSHRAGGAPNRSAGGVANRNAGGWADIGGTQSTDNTSIEQKSGPFMRPREERNTSSGGAGLRVKIIPSNQPLGTTRDDNSIYDDRPIDDEPSSGSTGRRDRDSSTNADIGVSRSGGNPQPAPPYDRQSGGSRRPLPRDYDDRDNQIGAGSRSTPPPVLRRGENEEVEPVASTGRDTDAAETGAIKLNASVVNLNVVVTDRSGKAMPNLRKEDFQVTENGEDQAIEFFSSSTAPFNMVLLLDLSGSIQDKLDVVKAAALKFIEVIGPNDKVAVVTFTHEVRVISQLTNNKELLRNRIQMIPKAIGGTAFYEAMWFTLADTLRGTEGQRNAIVVMTDGVDSSLDRYNPAPTRVSFNRLAARLEESDALVFPIYLDTEYEEVFERQQSTTEAYATARIQLERIAELTGGQVFQAQEAKDLSNVYKQVAAVLRTVYSVGYYPTNGQRDGSYRKVRVGVNRNGVAVRTRRGYYAR